MGKHLLEVLERLSGGNAFSNLDPPGLCDRVVHGTAAAQRANENKENDQISFTPQETKIKLRITSPKMGEAPKINYA